MRIQSFALCCLVLVLQSPLAESAIKSWTAPVIASTACATGTLSIPESQAISTPITTFVAVADASKVTYALSSTVAPFALSTAGVLTITANLDADKTSATHTLEIVATEVPTDSGTTAGSGTATITVTVTDIDETPTFASTSFKTCIKDGSAIDTTVITVLAKDADPGDTITHNIKTGDTNNDFKIGATTGVIQVAKALSMTKIASYTLVIHAVDDENTPKTGSTTVAVTVSAECKKNNAAFNGVSIASLLLSILTLLMI